MGVAHFLAERRDRPELGGVGGVEWREVLADAGSVISQEVHLEDQWQEGMMQDSHTEWPHRDAKSGVVSCTSVTIYHTTT